MTVPVRFSTFPNLPMGVFAIILWPLADKEPSSLNNKNLFCLVAKNPGAMALMRTAVLAKCTAIHLVKLSMAALAAE